MLFPSLPWLCVHIASSKPVACGLQFFLRTWFEWDSGRRIFALLCIGFKSHLRRSVFVFGAFRYTPIVSHWRPVCHVPKVPIPIVAENWHTYFVDKWLYLIGNIGDALKYRSRCRIWKFRPGNLLLWTFLCGLPIRECCTRSRHHFLKIKISKHIKRFN